MLLTFNAYEQQNQNIQQHEIGSALCVLYFSKASVQLGIQTSCHSCTKNREASTQDVRLEWKSFGGCKDQP